MGMDPMSPLKQLIIKLKNLGGFDMITLPLHTSHALQPLGVACFKPLKIAFKKEKNRTMVRKNYT
jgi:hypothetical protein